MKDEECPGDGKCHGCLSWCSWCGSVNMVCDSPGCDSHQRMEEVAEDLRLAEGETTRCARALLDAFYYRMSHIELHSRLADPLTSLERDVSGRFELRTAWSSFAATKSWLSEATDKHRDYVRAVEGGYYRMTPRTA